MMKLNVPGQLRERASEADEKPRGDEHLEVLGSTLASNTHEQNETSQPDGLLPAIVVRNVWTVPVRMCTTQIWRGLSYATGRPAKLPGRGQNIIAILEAAHRLSDAGTCCMPKILL